jgi:pyruvate/2-oxoglutarate dehydrogenase complex dihydrolipoamide acyltransferase (E2) component
MATEIKLPRLGQGMESGTVVRWLKQEGDRIEKGEPLYEVDTEKVTQEVEADASGVLLKISVEEGEVPVGQTVAVIGEEGEDVPEAEPEAEPEVDEEPGEEGSRAPARDEERERGREAEAVVETAPAEP